MIEHVAGALRTSAAARWASVRRLRVENRVAMATRRENRRAIAWTIRRHLRDQRAAVMASLRTAHASVWQLWPETSCARDLDRTDDHLQASVLRVIRKHPEGIRAFDVGNELGVDWRRVAILVRRLVDAGEVEQVGQDFYPAGKANRRW